MKAINHLELRHWHLKRDVDDVLWAFADRAGESVNSLSESMLRELATIVDFAERSRVRALGFLSAKQTGFIAGFDIREFETIRDSQALREALRQANEIFNQLEALPFPTACGIEGFCLGGGLELALACQYRVATESDATRLGLPEVQLGLHPGFAGTVRLSRLIGGRQALPLMLTGRGIRARAARRLGLVDTLVAPHADLMWSTRKVLLGRRKRSRPRWLDRLSNTQPVREVLAYIIRRETLKKADPRHYPAPFAIIELWRRYANRWSEMARAEQGSFARLFETATAENLRRVFHLMELLKSDGKSAGAPVRRVHVIGAGVMGGDIAAWCALRGLEVSLQDRSVEAIENAQSRAQRLFKRRLRGASAQRSAKARLLSDPDGLGLSRADVVIEAIVENLDAKRNLYAAIEAQMRDDAVLATNTSALPLEQLGEGLSRPERFIGLHFFNPVAQLPLLEIVRAERSDDDSMQRGAAFANQIGKLPLKVNSAPGFVVNRVLAPYLIEALNQIDAGYSKEAIDAAAVDFGMPMGPIELADQIGLDVCLHVVETLGKPDEAARVSSRLQSFVDSGYLGKKSERGFYRWRNNKPVRASSRRQPGAAQDSLAEQLITPLLDECERVLADGVVADADRLDAGVIFGTGFAPFRGGPLHYRRSSAIGREGA